MTLALILIAALSPASADPGALAGLRELGGSMGVSAGAPAVAARPVSGQTPASGSAQQTTVNNDGSVLLWHPSFGDPAIPISSRGSSRAGVCALNGLGKARSHAGDGDHALTASIDSSGKFVGYERYNLRYANKSFTALLCDEGAQTQVRPTPGERARSVSRNDDGSWTIAGPYIAGPGGTALKLSAHDSSHKGVCAYYGFKTAVGSPVSSGDYSHTLSVDSDGTLFGFVLFNLRYANTGIDSIVCRE